MKLRPADLPVIHRVGPPSLSYTKRLGRQVSVPTKQLDIAVLKDVGVGKQLSILACGPSLNEVPFECLTERYDNVAPPDIMCVNKPILNLNPKYWLFVDDSQRKRNELAFNNYEGTLINSFGVRGRRPNQVLLQQRDLEGFYQDGSVYLGKSSCYVAMQVAAYMNYDTIFIYALDMCEVGGQTHFYGKNPDATKEYRIPRFDQEEVAYQHACDILPYETRQKFLFMSPYNNRRFIREWYRK